MRRKRFWIFWLPKGLPVKKRANDVIHNPHPNPNPNPNSNERPRIQQEVMQILCGNTKYEESYARTRKILEIESPTSTIQSRQAAKRRSKIEFLTRELAKVQDQALNLEKKAGMVPIDSRFKAGDEVRVV